jgi:nitrate/TMAO reductase-like tetraheme cytochrome c subunit
MSKILVAAAVLLCVFSGAFGGEVCLYCHSDSSVTSVYKNTSHARKKVTCVDCHLDRSRSNLKALWDKIFYSISFSYKNAHPAGIPTTRTCISCHNAIDKFNIIAEAALPEKVKTIGMVVSHDKHSALRDSCMKCHGAGKYKKNKTLAIVSRDDPMGCISCHHGVAHLKPDKYDVPFPSEKTCALCHNSANKCPSMKKISDVKDKSRCTECHPNQYSF